MWRIQMKAPSEGDPAPREPTRRRFLKGFSWLVTAVMSGVIGEVIGRWLPRSETITTQRVPTMSAGYAVTLPEIRGSLVATLEDFKLTATATVREEPSG